MAIELTTVAIVKNIMELPPSDLNHDTALLSLIRGVSLDFQKTTGRGVDSIARTEYFDIQEGTRTLYLKGYPVDTGETITIYQDTDRNFESASEVDTEFYDLDAEEGIIYLYQNYPVSRRSVKITYTGGMAVMTSPDAGSEFWNLYPDVAMAVALEVIKDQKMIPNLGASAIKIHNDSTTFFSNGKRSDDFLATIYNYARIII